MKHKETHREVRLVCRVLHLLLDDDEGLVVDDVLERDGRKLVERVELLPHETLFREVRRDDHPARLVPVLRLHVPELLILVCAWRVC